MSSWMFPKFGGGKSAETESKPKPVVPPSAAPVPTAGMFGGLSVKQPAVPAPPASTPATPNVAESPELDPKSAQSVAQEKVAAASEATVAQTTDVIPESEPAASEVPATTSSLFNNLSVRETGSPPAEAGAISEPKSEELTKPEATQQDTTDSSSAVPVGGSAFSFLSSSAKPSPNPTASEPAAVIASSIPGGELPSAASAIADRPVDLLSGLNNVVPTKGITKKRASKQPGFARRESSDVGVVQRGDESIDTNKPTHIALEPKVASNSNTTKTTDTKARVVSDNSSSALPFLKSTKEAKPIENREKESTPSKPKVVRSKVNRKPLSGFQQILANFQRSSRSFVKNLENVDQSLQGCSNESTLLASKLEYLRANLVESEEKQGKAMEEEDFEKAEQLQQVIDQTLRDIQLTETNMQRLNDEIAKNEQKRLMVFGEEVQFIKETVVHLGDFSSSKTLEAKEYLSNSLKEFDEAQVELDEKEEILALDKENIVKDLAMIMSEQDTINSKINGKTTDLRNEKQEWVTKRDRVEEEIQELKRQLAIKEAERDEYDSEIAVLDDGIKSITSKFGSRLGELNQREQVYRKRQADIEKQYEELDSARQLLTENRNNAEAKASYMEQEAVAMVSQLDVVDGMVQRLEREQEARSSGTGGLKHEEAEVAKMRTECTSNRQAIEMLQRRIAQLETSMMEKRRALMDIDALIPGLNEQKQLAVSTRNFKEAGVVSAKIKEITAKREESEAAVEKAREDHQNSAKLLSERILSQEALLKDIETREVTLRTEQLKLVQAKRVLLDKQMKEVAAITPASTEDEDEEYSFGNTLWFLLEAEAESYRLEAVDLADRLGDPSLCELPKEGDLAENSVIDEPSVDQVIEDDSHKSESAEVVVEEPANDSPIDDVEREVPEEHVEDISARLQLAERVKAVRKEIADCEASIDAAVEQEDFERAAELDSTCKVLMVEQADLLQSLQLGVEDIDAFIADNAAVGRDALSASAPIVTPENGDEILTQENGVVDATSTLEKSEGTATDETLKTLEEDVAAEATSTLEQSDEGAAAETLKTLEEMPVGGPAEATGALEQSDEGAAAETLKTLEEMSVGDAAEATGTLEKSEVDAAAEATSTLEKSEVDAAADVANTLEMSEVDAAEATGTLEMSEGATETTEILESPEEVAADISEKPEVDAVEVTDMLDRSEEGVVDATNTLEMSDEAAVEATGTLDMSDGQVSAINGSPISLDDDSTQRI